MRAEYLGAEASVAEVCGKRDENGHALVTQNGHAREHTDATSPVRSRFALRGWRTGVWMERRQKR